MTATDELRKLLDERGVEYYRHEEGEPLRELKEGTDRATSWRLGKASCTVVECEDGTLDVWIDRATPAQAVEATLGRGTCRMTRVEDEERILHGWMECSECGPVYPPAAERIQDAVKFCPFCGRRVVEE